MKLLSFDVQMRDTDLSVFVLFYWVLFWQGEQGDLGETGYSGETGLPGPQVTNKTSELFLC